MYDILLLLMQPMKNYMYSACNYLFIQLLWKACFYPIVSAVMLAFSMAATGVAWCVYNFFQIPFIKNFASDICEVFSDLGSAVENGYSFIRSIFSKLPDEVGVKTNIDGAKGYVKYLASNVISIAALGYLSHHFYKNYYRLFEMDSTLNNERAKYDLPRIQTHYPINLFITGTVAALQFSACVATAISAISPNSSITKFRALAIAGMAEFALTVYKYANGKSLDDLSKFEQYKNDVSSRDARIEDMDTKNRALGSQLALTSSEKLQLASQVQSATCILTAWGEFVRVLGSDQENDRDKVEKLLNVSLQVNAARSKLLQIGNGQATNGVNV